MINTTSKGLDLESIRSQFPALSLEVHGKSLVYLDNGATSQKPKVVIDAVSHFYEKENANIHRGVHHLSQEATARYEEARTRIQKYIGAAHSEEVLFTSGTTGSINLLAFSFGELLKPGDEIIISAMEHHSNIVPWQMTCERKGCSLKVIPINQAGELEMESYAALLSDKTRLVAVTHISNTLGTINPVQKIIEMAHEKGAVVLIDGAQSIQHMPINVRELDCDFFAFSGHKVFGPTGVGVLYGKKELLDEMPPWQGGGDMIAKVTFAKTTYNELPHKFEAGTPNIAGGIGLGAAFEFLEGLDMNELMRHEQQLAQYAEEQLLRLPGVRLIGEAKEKTSVVSFVVDGAHPFDIGTLLDKMGIAVRTGHHCTQPLMDFYNIPGTVRASFAFYNTMEEVDVLVAGLERALRMLI
ncbi:MAG: cysteine sulfinate desulfinase [Bacteroidetes bacterium RIFCSPHIGHO2_02_FULL_44_7]|nr:MAG: cysteine sulfinate desulfinase [Bacteroidetes bacterium RIFCSPHIGHO2_02_FULL_44_7]